MSIAEQTAVALDLHPVAGAMGAEIRGLDLSQPLDEATFAALHAAFLEHIVLVFPDQDLSPEAQVAFTARFGPVEPHPLTSRRGVEGHPEILVIENRPGTRGARNDTWHSDISFSQTPPALSVLHGIAVPEGKGDTMFCNMVAAWDDLSESLRDLLRPLRAEHSALYLARRNADPDNNARSIEALPEAVLHPVCRRHPESGRETLFVNPAFTHRFEDMSDEESAPLLDFLAGHASRPENVYRHHWRRGDVVMWDNRAAMHYGVYDYGDGDERYMHRTTAAGDRPV